MKRCVSTKRFSNNNNVGDSWPWTDMLGEMQGEVVSHLDMYSKRALALTSTASWERWGKSNDDELLWWFNVGAYAPVSYTDSLWAFMFDYCDEYFPLWFVGACQREDEEHFFRLLDKIKTVDPAVVKGHLVEYFDGHLTDPKGSVEELLLGAIVCGNSPRMFEAVMRRYPNLATAFCEDDAAALYVCGPQQFDTKPNPAMIPCLVRSFGPGVQERICSWAIEDYNAAFITHAWVCCPEFLSYCKANPILWYDHIRRFSSLHERDKSIQVRVAKKLLFCMLALRTFFPLTTRDLCHLKTTLCQLFRTQHIPMEDYHKLMPLIHELLPQMTFHVIKSQ